MAWAGAGAVALAPGGAARAEEPADEIAAARAALEEAQAALENAGEGEQRLAALGRAVAAQEGALAAYRGAMRALARRAVALSDRLVTERGRLGDLLAVLQSMSAAPSSALFAFPGGPVDAARAATLLAAVAPELEAQRIALASELVTLRRIRVEQELARVGALEALAALQALRADTAIALDRRRAKLPPRRLMRAQARAAAESAASLGALAETLDRLIGATGPSPAFLARQGTLLAPVAGRITARFGDADPWGNPGAGMSYRAPAFAQVSSPMDATLRYAGPLEGYGTVAILEPEAGWLLVLAGLGRVERGIGEPILAGERIGDLGGDLPEGPEILLAGDDDGEDGMSGLYIELRQEGVPVDPAPWFSEDR
ncbi:MAG: hypothetical protein AAF074_22915 [Pseudomonadota bacterium]